MKRQLTAALASLVLAGGFLAATPPTGHAAGNLSVTSPSCGRIQVRNTTPEDLVVAFDSRDRVTVPKGQTRTLTSLPGGAYYWITGPVASEWSQATRRVTVPTCTGGSSRPVDGDQDGDGRADVLGIHTSGALYYYRTTSKGLADGIQAGRGWGQMVFMQQVNELVGRGSGNHVFAIHANGTLWRYANHGKGRLADGVQIGHGFQGYDNFAITPLNTPLAFGGHMLLARRGNTLSAWELTATGVGGVIPVAESWGRSVRTLALRDFNGDDEGDVISIRTDGTMWFSRGDVWGDPELLSTPVRVGSGWGQMATVTSPGSTNGDHLSDLVARNANGNLYSYVNKGGRWSEAVQIGRNWTQIRLLA